MLALSADDQGESGSSTHKHLERQLRESDALFSPLQAPDNCEHPTHTHTHTRKHAHLKILKTSQAVVAHSFNPSI